MALRQAGRAPATGRSNARRGPVEALPAGLEAHQWCRDGGQSNLGRRGIQHDQVGAITDRQPVVGHAQDAGRTVGDHP